MHETQKNARGAQRVNASKWNRQDVSSFGCLENKFEQNYRIVEIKIVHGFSRERKKEMQKV